MSRTAATEAPSSSRSGLRVEIQLLRAVAVLVVVGNHFAPKIVRGGYVGVDVFFVISGYLITSHLVREMERTGRLSLVGFWMRRIRRLLPASMLVLAAAALGTILFVPETLWQSVMRQLTACALYVQNWALAADAQNYFASSEDPSPVTHYWSLSVEEQFYAFWPILALGAFVIGRRLLGRPRAVVTLAISVVVAASLAYSIHLTAVRPNAAYFVTFTRIWELGAGALLALVPLPHGRVRWPLALLGWAAIAVSVVTFRSGSAVPGWIAALPVLGSAAVIAAGDAFVAHPLRWVRPLLSAGVWLGGVSYAVYLWHWPLIVLAPYALHTHRSPALDVAVLGLTLVLAQVSTRYVEEPLRRAKWAVDGRAWRTFGPALVAMALITVAATSTTRLVDSRLASVERATNAAADAQDKCFGALAVWDHCRALHSLRYSDSPLMTSLNSPNRPKWGFACQQTPTGTAVKECQFGVPADRARYRIALVGDSHAAHWTGALDVLARQNDWNVVMVTKSSCAANTAPGLKALWDPTLAASCHTWVREVATRIADDPSIDTVVTSAISRRYGVEGVQDQVGAQIVGYRDLWRRWTRAGKSVVAIGDVPRLDVGNVPACVATAPTTRDPCTTPRGKALGPDPLMRAARAQPEVVPASVTQAFCDPRRCHAVIGGIVAYGDDSHILNVFSRTLAPFLRPYLEKAIAESRVPHRTSAPVHTVSH